MNLKACIIDLDGTLVDTLGDFVAVLAEVLGELGLPPASRATVEHTVGQGSEHLIRTVLAAQGGAPEHYEAAWASYQRHYRRLNGQHAEVYPGVREGLRAMRERGLPLACVTNKPAAFARELLARKGLADEFAVVFGGDDFIHKKPQPEPLLGACKALGTEPGQTCMIGDSRNDAQAAQAAGCPLVLVTYGYNHGEDILAVPAWEHVSRLDGWSWLHRPAGSCALSCGDCARA
jgi:phosphoglycolate phosphatase